MRKNGGFAGGGLSDEFYIELFFGKIPDLWRIESLKIPYSVRCVNSFGYMRL